MDDIEMGRKRKRERECGEGLESYSLIKADLPAVYINVKALFVLFWDWDLYVLTFIFSSRLFDYICT